MPSPDRRPGEKLGESPTAAAQKRGPDTRAIIKKKAQAKDFPTNREGFKSFMDAFLFF